jgi:hypothetical protein
MWAAYRIRQITYATIDSASRMTVHSIPDTTLVGVQRSGRARACAMSKNG